MKTANGDASKDGRAALDAAYKQSVELCRRLGTMRDEARSGLEAGPPEALEAAAAKVRTVLRARAVRAQLFPDGLSQDPAWDMLMDLMLARLTSKRVCLTSVCVAAHAPATTALRWINALAEQGLVEKSPDPSDGRRANVALSDRGFRLLSDYLARID